MIESYNSYLGENETISYIVTHSKPVANQVAMVSIIQLIIFSILGLECITVFEKATYHLHLVTGTPTQSHRPGYKLMSKYYSKNKKKPSC